MPFSARLALAIPILVVGMGRAMTSAVWQDSTPAPATQLAEVETIGPKVGDTVPDFALRDQRGQLRSLDSVMGPKGAMLVFFRSADW